MRSLRNAAAYALKRCGQELSLKSAATLTAVNASQLGPILSLTFALYARSRLNSFSSIGNDQSLRKNKILLMLESMIQNSTKKLLKG